MSEKKRPRLRALPQIAQVTTQGDCRFFTEKDAAPLVALVGRSLKISETALAAKLNAISGQFLQHYALLVVQTQDSRIAEWTEALAHDGDRLLQKLAMPDRGYPETRLLPEVRSLLTGAQGYSRVFRSHQLQTLGIKDSEQDIDHALNQIGTALWTLKQAARNATAQYKARARLRSMRRDMGAKPQHVFFLDSIATVLQSAFGYQVPALKPGADGPFVKAALFVSRRIVESVKASDHDFTDKGTDRAAVQRLGLLTGDGAANLWARAQRDKAARREKAARIEKARAARRAAE
jgi:hypothetical protein